MVTVAAGQCLRPSSEALRVLAGLPRSVATRVGKLHDLEALRASPSCVADWSP